MRTRIFKITSLFIFLAFLLPSFFISGSLTSMAEMTPSEEREALEKELQGLEKQIAQYEQDITKTQQEKKTLQNQIYILRNKIYKLNLQIQQSNATVKDLGFQIEDTESSIEETSLKIEDSREKLAEVLKLIYQEDQRSLIEILLSERELSDFFDNLVALEALNSKTNQLLGNIKTLKSYLEDQKESLSEEKEDLEKMVAIQILQKEAASATQGEQEELLEKTKGEETIYQKLLTSSKEKAAKIRSRIFELIGVPEAPTFGEALEIAKFVSDQTGIRPAFLLAVLTQESNIGKNVGQCYLKNPTSGSGVVAYSGKEISWVMKPGRDVEPFLEITKDLGRDPYSTPISCPMSYGWGGAMGPGQFIPSTWMLIKDKVKAVTGTTPDPWNIKDAFLATGIYLKDLGGTQNEFRAAMKYFSGSSWSKYEEFYGRSVLSIAKNYEEDIKELEKTL